MAQKGYWAVCEDVIPKGSKDGIPTACLIYVDGFFYAEVMGENRLEAFLRAKQKLKDNIGFLDKCWNEIPPPASSDSAPEKVHQDGVVLMFISLKEMGIPEDLV